MAKLTDRWVIPAGRAKAGQHLSEAQQRRYMNAGITKGQYESGVKVTKARGHSKTPEHGLQDAFKHPEKYKEYIKKRPTGGQLSPQDIEDLKTRVLANMDRQVGDYLKYNRQRVIGRIDSMSIRELEFTEHLSEDEIVERARPQYKGNPWHYH